jgi:hypothetical protein
MQLALCRFSPGPFGLPLTLPKWTPSGHHKLGTRNIRFEIFTSACR